MTHMHFIRELRYLNQTSLLRQDIKIRGVISNVGQNDRLSFVSLSHQIDDGGTARYSEKEIIAGRYIPFKAGESVAGCVLTKVEQTKERHVTFVKRRASNCRKIRSRRNVEVMKLISCLLRHMNIYSVF